MKKTVEKAIGDSLKSLGIEPPAHIEIEAPKDDSFGDMATPIAMTLAKTLRRKPRDIADEIVRAIAQRDAFSRIEVAGAGFINFTFSDDFIYSSLRSLIKDRSGYLRCDTGRGRRALIEFVSANPTGPLHLGHGRGAAVGSALSNLLNAAGYKVEREYYINDAGGQVKSLGLSTFARYKELLGIGCPFPEDGYRAGYVIEIAQAILNEVGDRYKDADFDGKHEDVEGYFTDFSLKMMLNEIKADLQAFGVSFDKWQSERGLHEAGSVENAINYLRAKDCIYDNEGALWFRATKFGDEKDRVIKKTDAEFTYFASDIAYHKKKIDSGYDELINIWGADHHGYIPRLEAVIEALGYDRKRLKVLLVQMVTLLRGGRIIPMSKRAGQFVTLKEVIDEVGADTTKFIFLTRRPDSHLEFDIEAAKAASSENPVYYVQYANARINSIFSHAEKQGIEGAKDANFGLFQEAPITLLSEPFEIKLIKKLLMYPMVFESAALAHEPHRITFYLQELSAVFHQYYNKFKVVTEDRQLTLARLALSSSVRIVLQDGLEILGITAPEKM